MPFLDSLDIANRCAQILGSPQIFSVTEDSKINREATFAYDKLRRVELRRNIWRFAIRKAVLRPLTLTMRLLTPPTYSSTVPYFPGSIVQDANAVMWISQLPENLNNAPGGNNEAWEPYFGPLTVDLYDSTTTYSIGELVYMPVGNPGGYQVYMSLSSVNAVAPNVATAWAATVTYKFDDVVSYSGSQWRSLIALNTNVTPVDGPLAFDPTATYTIGQTVTGSDTYIYSSVGNGNIGHDPTTDAGVHWTNTNLPNAWSRTPAIAVSATSWLPLGTLTLRNLNLLYPIGSGPSTQGVSRNAYRLPAGWLKEAPQNPKAGATSFLGAPSGLRMTDWEYDSNFIVTSDSQPITYRFVADIQKVRSMDDMFCEGLACRIASAICETVTQSDAKLQTIASQYKLFMGEARTANLIEEGPVELPEDDYITCRL